MTDIYVDPTPKKGRGLVRSHAVGRISDTRPAVKGKGKANDKANDNPVTEQEIPSETEEDDEELQETPKKRKKSLNRRCGP
jgi:hypothetical protein